MSLHEDLKAYLDGELDASRAEEVRTAIEHDPNLKREAEQLRILGSSVRANASSITPQGLENTLAALERRRTSTRVLGRRWLLGGGFALASAVAFLVFFPAFQSAKLSAKRSFGLSNDGAVVASTAASAKSPGSMTADAVAGEGMPQAKALAKADSAKSAPMQKFAAKAEAPTIDRDQAVQLKRNAGGSGSLESRPMPPRHGNWAAPVDSYAKNPALHIHQAESSAVKLRPSPTLKGQSPATHMAAQADATFYSRRLTPVSVVTLAFASKDEGVARVTEAIEKYQVLGGKNSTRAFSVFKENSEQMIQVEVDEDHAESIIAKLRQLGANGQPAGKVEDTVMRGAAGSGGRDFTGAAGGLANPSLGMAADRSQSPRATAKNLKGRESRESLGATGKSSGAAVTAPVETRSTEILKATSTEKLRSKVPSLTKAQVQTETKPFGDRKADSHNAASLGEKGTKKSRTILIVIQQLPKKEPVP